MIGPLLLYTRHLPPHRGFFLSFNGQVLAVVRWGTRWSMWWPRYMLLWQPAAKKKKKKKRKEKKKKKRKKRCVKWPRRRMDYIGVIYRWNVVVILDFKQFSFQMLKLYLWLSFSNSAKSGVNLYSGLWAKSGLPTLHVWPGEDLRGGGSPGMCPLLFLQKQGCPPPYFCRNTVPDCVWAPIRRWFSSEKVLAPPLLTLGQFQIHRNI